MRTFATIGLGLCLTVSVASAQAPQPQKAQAKVEEKHVLALEAEMEAYSVWCDAQGDAVASPPRRACVQTLWFLRQHASEAKAKVNMEKFLKGTDDMQGFKGIGQGKGFTLPK